MGMENEFEFYEKEKEKKKEWKKWAKTWIDRKIGAWIWIEFRGWIKDLASYKQYGE